jgi:thiamine pyrophosphate-dependent acetolactate synthase large subunit-like protein
MSAIERDGRLLRRPLVEALLEARGEMPVIAGLGAAAWDLAAAGDRDDQFYLWGAMGLAASIGLGLALARPERRVLVVTGDGEMMMGTGSLAAIGRAAPANLAILVLDNEAFGETGQQSGLTGGPPDLAALAAAAGFARTMTATDAGGVAALRRLLHEERGPVMGVAKVLLSDDPLILPPKSGALLAARFRQALGTA